MRDQFRPQTPAKRHRHPELTRTAGSTPYNGGTSGSASTNVQAAVDELFALLAGATTPAAEDVGVTDAGGFYTEDDVEGILAELPGLFVAAAHGGKEIVNVVADAGSSETLDMADGNWHDVTLTEACSITIDGATVGRGCAIVIDLHGSFAVTWVDTIDWGDAGAPSAAADVTVVLRTIDGGTTYRGTHSQATGGGGGATDLDGLTDVVITSATEGNTLRRGPSTWVNSNLHWEPMIGTDGLIMLDSAGGPSMHEVAH